MYSEMLRKIVRSGLSQAEIGSILGINQGTVSRHINGNIREPKITLARRIEQLYEERCPALRKRTR